MDTTYATVITKDGIRIDFVLVIDGVPQHWELQDGESLIYEDWDEANTLAIFHTIVRWTGSKWVGEGEPIPQPEPEPEQPDTHGFLIGLMGIEL